MSQRRRWIVLGALAVLLTSAAAGAPVVLRRWDAFAVDRVEVRGTRYLAAYDALVQSGISRQSNVFDDFEPWRARLLAHPMVLAATIERRLPNTLRVSITETEPVALARTPELTPVDARGRSLPIDPSSVDLDVPLLTMQSRPNAKGEIVDATTRAVLAVLASLQTRDARLYSWVSEAGNLKDGVRLQLRSPVGAEALVPSNPRALRLNELQIAFADLATRGELSKLERIDARFHDQIVVVLKEADHVPLFPAGQQVAHLAGKVERGPHQYQGIEMRPNLVAGLDIGSTKTCAVIAEVMPDGVPARAGDLGRMPTVKILGVGQSRTGGMRREVVTDIEGTTESVRAAMKEAELMAGVSVDRVFVGVAGEYIHARTSNGVVAVGGDEIRIDDVKRVQEVARAVVVPADREVLHVLPQEYIVDHQSNIRDPIGMAGTRLEAEVYIVTSSIAATQNLRKAVSRAGYKIEATIHEPLATAQAVVAEDERDVGVALVDLGGSTTELAIFRDGKMRHLASIPWGGGTVTNDLAKGLSITYAEAEKAKEKHGVAFAQLVDPRETVELPGPGPGSKRQVARELIAHIIEQRLDEILGLVAREIEHAGEIGKLGAGAVLTGGGAGLAGAVDVAQHAFGMPVRIGIPGEHLTGLADSVRRPQFATATGLTLMGARTVEYSSGGFALGQGAVGKAVSWLKEFF